MVSRIEAKPFDQIQPGVVEFVERVSPVFSLLNIIQIKGELFFATGQFPRVQLF
jgi:hypothetical protein